MQVARYFCRHRLQVLERYSRILLLLYEAFYLGNTMSAILPPATIIFSISQKQTHWLLPYMVKGVVNFVAGTSRQGVDILLAGMTKVISKKKNYKWAVCIVAKLLMPR